jgi:hypothetical protein
MPNGAEWVTTRVAEARKPHAAVTDAVSIRITGLLEGPLTDGQLSATELTKVASALLKDMDALLPTEAEP